MTKQATTRRQLKLKQEQEQQKEKETTSSSQPETNPSEKSSQEPAAPPVEAATATETVAEQPVINKTEATSSADAASSEPAPMIEDTAAELEAVKTVVKVQRAARKPKSVKVQDLNASSGNKSKMDQDDDEDDDDEDDDSDDEDDEDEFEDEDEDDSMEHDVSNENKPSSANKKNADSEKLRRRLPMSIKELIDYHSGNGKSIKEIVSRINAVCRADEKVSYGYVQKYLYRKKLEATTAKKARYYRKKYGFVYRRMRRKPVLTENHKNSRISWCQSHVGDNFGQDIFIGKTSLKPFLASLNQLKGQPADPNQPRQQTTLHLWGAISRKGASPLQIFDGALTTAMYLEILLENVVPFIAENFPEGHRFHQDNNPKHSAKLSQEFLESTGINWVKSPPRSHDLNPIELVWTDLIQVVAKRLPKTIGQVVVAVKEYWKTLTPEKCSEFIDKLVDVSLSFFLFRLDVSLLFVK